MDYYKGMIHRILGIVVCLCLVVSVGAQVQPRVLTQIKDTAACNRWVEAQLGRMTLKQKIGQLFIHTIEPSLMQRHKEYIRRCIEDYEVGGILFSKGKLPVQAELTNLAQQWSKIPLLVTFDGEWGLSMRLDGMPEFPKNRVLGCITNDTLIYRYGREVARQLHEIGVQVNFAPVADVDNNPDNPVINVRSFGSSPQNVSRKVLAYARGLEDGGVMAVCKHFPGHGDTETDSHQDVPVLHFDRNRLDSVELYPFREAVEAGVGGMMVGHLQVPELGNRPASVSKRIVTSLLKEELGFDGLVFTDALEMEGIKKNVDNVCAEALIAGNDILLVPRNLKRELAGVLSAVKEGRLTEEQITAKCRKVLTYKYALGLNRRPVIRKEGLAGRIHTVQTDSLLSELDRVAVVVLKDSAEVLPLELSLSGNVLLSISPSLASAYPFYKELKEALDVNWVYADVDSLEQIRTRIRPAQQVIIALHQADCNAYIPLIEEVASDKPVVLVCFASQRVLAGLAEVLPKVSAVVLAHRDTEDLQSEVARVLTGRGKADARLSVEVAHLWKSGEGMTLDPDRPRSYEPEDFGMDSKTLSYIDTLAQEGIREHAFSGCHVMILKEGYPIYNRCFGTFTYDSKQKVKENSLYDLASLSKVAGTLLAVMKLYDEGRFGLTDEVSSYLPYLKGTDKRHITVRDLLFHESGLPAYIPFYEEAINLKSCKGGLFRKKPDAHHRMQVDENLYVCTDFSYKKEWVSGSPSEVYSLPLSDSLYLNPAFRREILKQIVESPLKGHAYRYSCLNFMLLKEMVEKIACVPMDVYLDSVFYKPMGLRHIGYNPLKRFDRTQIVPTVRRDFLRGGPLQGYVHDEAAAFMGGVSGNAGLFSTARDVAVLFQMLLDRGVCGNRRLLSRSTCDLFVQMKAKDSRRGLGFDKPDMEDADKSPCAPEAPASVFGHTGFTGTCAWADPDNGLVFVFLSNRTYPQPFTQKNLSRMNIRIRMQQAMYQSIKK